MPAVVATNVRVTLAGVKSRCASYPRPTIRTSSARTPSSPCERVADSFPGYTLLRRGPLSIARAVVDPRVKRRATRVISRATEEGEEKRDNSEVAKVADNEAKDPRAFFIVHQDALIELQCTRTL